MNSIVDLASVYIPGFILMQFWKFLTDKKHEDINLFHIWCITISFIINKLAVESISLLKLHTVRQMWIIAALIVIFAILICLIEKFELPSKLLKFANRRTPSKYIWEDVFDNYYGTLVVFKVKDGREITGVIAYYEEKEDPHFAILVYENNDANGKIKYTTVVKSSDIKDMKLYHTPESKVLKP